MKRVLVVVVLLLVIALPAMATVVDDGGNAVVGESNSFTIDWLYSVMAFFLPLVTSALKRVTWSTQTKRWFALSIAAVVGVITVAADMGWTFDDPMMFAQAAIGAIAQIWMIAAVAYRNIWEDTPIETKLAGKRV